MIHWLMQLTSIKDNKPLCLVPWTGIDIRPSGTIAPCCKYRESAEEKLNITEVSIDDYTNSAFLKKIKDTMLQNKWPEGCFRCKQEEASGIKSKRILDYERWTTEFDNYTEDKGYIVASIAFGNTCNLKCITCHSGDSSLWRQEYIDIYGIDQVGVKKLSSDASEIYDAMPNIIHIDIPGGEPFLSEIKKQKRLLQRYVDTGQSKDIALHYTTNAQIFPGEEWWTLWQNFKEIDMQLSIDGVDARYAYIRFPANKNILKQNVEKYLAKEQNNTNVRLSVSHTISAYNVYYLTEFFDWCEQVGLPLPWCGVVNTPKHMRPQVYPQTVKDKIIEHLQSSQHKDIHTWATYLSDNDSSAYYDEFLRLTDAHDLYRNLNFAKTFPELKKLLDLTK
jgi:organic radical activating enzyme